MALAIQKRSVTCSDCGAQCTVTPDPYGNGSAFEFKRECSSQNHDGIISWSHERDAPLFESDPTSAQEYESNLQSLRFAKRVRNAELIDFYQQQINKHLEFKKTTAQGALF